MKPGRSRGGRRSASGPRVKGGTKDGSKRGEKLRQRGPRMTSAMEYVCLASFLLLMIVLGAQHMGHFVASRFHQAAAGTDKAGDDPATGRSKE